MKSTPAFEKMRREASQYRMIRRLIEADRNFRDDVPIPTVQDPNTYEFSRLITEAATLRTIRDLSNNA